MLTRRRFQKLVRTKYWDLLEYLYNECSKGVNGKFSVSDMEYCLSSIVWRINSNLKVWNVNYLCGNNEKFLKYCMEKLRRTL